MTRLFNILTKYEDHFITKYIKNCPERLQVREMELLRKSINVIKGGYKMDLVQTKENKFKLVVPQFKRIKGDFASCCEYVPYNEFFYFDSYTDATYYLNLLKNSDKCFIVGL